MAEVVGTLILGGLAEAGVVGVAVGSFSIGSTGITVATIVGTVAITAGLVGLQYALTTTPETPKPGDGSQAMRGAIMPRLGGYGRARVAGATVLYEEIGGVSFDVFPLISGKISAFVGFYLHDDEVTRTGVEVNALADLRYAGGRIHIDTRLGLPTETVFAEPNAALPSIWTAAHRGDGVASLALTCTSVPQANFQTIYPNGLPQPSAVLDLYPVYDPRDLGQDIDNPNTWAVSQNPVLNIIDFLTDPDHGMGLDWDVAIQPNIDALMDEADLCDETVALGGGGGEPRYSCSGVYTFDSTPESILGPMLAACDGWLAETPDGTFSLKVGAYRAPTVTLKAQHVVGFSVRYGAADEELINELTTSFTSPTHKYAEVAGDPWRDEDSISELGRTRSRALALKWVQSHTQVRRLAKRASARLNAPLRGTITTTLYGMRVLGERWLRLQYPFVAGLEDAVIEISGLRVSISTARVSFDWVVVDPDTIDDWTTAEEGEPPPTPGITAAAPMPVPQNVTATIEGDETSGFHSLVSFDDPSRPDFSYRVRYRIVSPEGPWVEQSTSTATLAAGRLTVSTAPVPGNAGLEVQAAFVGSTGVRSDWSVSAFIATVGPSLDFSIPQNSQYLLLLQV